MSIEDKAKSILLKLGMWWPDANSGTLRKAADAWNMFADTVDEVRRDSNKAAQTLIHHNKGEAIDAFSEFWGRYAKGEDAGWLSGVAKSARNMAKALEKFADKVDDAIEKLWIQIGIDAVAIAGGVLLTAVTGGASDEVAAGIVEMAAGLGIEVEAAVATIAAEMLTGAVFGGVAAMAIDGAVAQPVKIALGQQKSWSLDEVAKAADEGMILGGSMGGATELFRIGTQNILKDVLKSARPDLIEMPAAARAPKDCKCVQDPIDVVTGAMLLPQTDVVLPGALPLVFERTHISSYRSGGWFGPTWASTLDERVQLDPEGAVFVAADGTRLCYPIPKPGEPVLPLKGRRWPLVWDGAPDGVVTVTDPTTGWVRTFAHPLPTGVPGTVQLPLDNIQDRNGSSVAIHRMLNGTPTAIRHSGGYYLAVDTEGPRVTALRLLDEPPSAYRSPHTAAAGTTVLGYGYDDAGDLIEVINSSGVAFRFTYDADHRITSWRDRNGSEYGYVYDVHGRVVRTEGSDGFLSGTLVYDDENRTTVLVDSLGHRSTYRYDINSQVVEETDPLGSVTLTEWNARGDKRTSTTDPLGRTTRYAYDEVGNLTCLTLPDGTVRTAEYNSLCQALRITEPDGTVWLHTYDGLGNLLSTTDPAGSETHYEYDDSSHLSTVVDALGNVSRIICDAAGLPVSITDPLGQETKVRRDGFGRITEATDPLGRTTRTCWTSEGRPVRREHPDGTTESWAWDGEGNLLSHTDQAGHTTQYVSTHFDLPASRIDPDGTTYIFDYDTQLKLTGVTNPQGLTWTYTYDEAGRLVSETDFNGRTLTYSHNAAGELASRTNGAGEAIRFSYDTLGRVIERRADDGGVTTFTYDPLGRLTRAANADAEVVYEHDALGRPLSETVNGRAVRYAYDRVGRCLQLTTPSGLVSTWSYDAAGRPTELHTNAGGLSFTHDAAGREIERRLGDAATLTQVWDMTDRLRSQSLTKHGGHPEADRLLQHRVYAYRPDGYVTEIRELTAGTRRFDLTAMGRVSAVDAYGWSENYAYDAAGNLTRATAPGYESTGDRDFKGMLIRRAGRTTYEHDAQGRLVRKVCRLLNGKVRTWTFRWNAEDRLTGVITPEGDRWDYAYDALGRRISKKHFSADDSLSERISFSWDGTRLAETVASDGRVATWSYLPGGHRPVAQVEHYPQEECVESRLMSRFHAESQPDRHAWFYGVVTDLVGTPTELVSAAGEVVWQRRHTLWGLRLPSPDESEVGCPLGFPGQYHDAETGLSYNYFRYYDPQICSYISPDPLGLEPSPNHYAYTKNPTNWLDPLGLSCVDLSQATPHSGRFPKSAQPNEILVRRKDDGTVTAYAVYGPDGLPVKRVDVDPNSKPHGGVPAPHVLETERHVNPKTGDEFVTWKKMPRAARPDELPKQGGTP
ncbi:DUF6531 domain-containing protein [Streptomyces mobaraensis]|uniref:RHS repeat protein n=1 Tax=Streptomyces mobaraensis TaxID=35621 RepID=A0A5N5WD60_STRMB|nr:DUF6531 domain-containing protein [Streptomyces mobaraensis]KAB7850213.1 RHS repeat protein [Streptomyces mobaraensis]